MTDELATSEEWAYEDALRAENTELSARVSELTRLLAEAETAIRDASHLFTMRDEYQDEDLPEWRNRESVQRALQSGEGKEPSR